MQGHAQLTSTPARLVAVTAARTARCPITPRVVGAVVAATLALTGLGACSSGPKPDQAAFCRHYRTASQAASSLRQLDVTPIGDIQRQVRGADDEASAAAKVVPTDIAAPVRRLAEALHRFRRAVDAATTHAQVTSAADAYAAAASRLTTDQATVDAAARTRCGVAPDTTAPPTTPAAPSS